MAQQQNSNRGFRFFRGNQQQATPTPVPQAVQPAPYNMSQQSTPVPVSPPVESNRRSSRDSDDEESSSRSKKSDHDSSDSKSEKKKSDKDEDSSSRKNSKDSDKESSKEKSSKESSEKSDKGSKSVTAADEATSTVADFLLAAHEGNYSKAEEFLTPEVQKYFASELSAIYGSLKTVLDKITGDGTIAQVTYTGEGRGEGFRIYADIEYKSGQTSTRRFDLIKLKGDWKIALPVGPGADEASESGTSGNPATSDASKTDSQNSDNTAAASDQSPASDTGAPAIIPPRISAAVPVPTQTPVVKATAPAIPTPQAVTKTTTTSALIDAPWKTKN
jgi:hypothetical protein